MRQCEVCENDLSGVSIRTKYCGACAKKRNREARNKHYQTPQFIYQRYRLGARLRGLDFKISYQVFLRLWQKPCFYCGSEIKTIGIDRANNDFGYVKENIVPCCFVCNRMKSNKNLDQFIAHCRKIAYYQP